MENRKYIIAIKSDTINIIEDYNKEINRLKLKIKNLQSGFPSLESILKETLINIQQGGKDISLLQDYLLDNKYDDKEEKIKIYQSAIRNLENAIDYQKDTLLKYERGEQLQKISLTPQQKKEVKKIIDTNNPIDNIYQLVDNLKYKIL